METWRNPGANSVRSVNSFCCVRVTYSRKSATSASVVNKYWQTEQREVQQRSCTPSRRSPTTWNGQEVKELTFRAARCEQLGATVFTIDSPHVAIKSHGKRWTDVIPVNSKVTNSIEMLLFWKPDRWFWPVLYFKCLKIMINTQLKMLKPEQYWTFIFLLLN